MSWFKRTNNSNIEDDYLQTTETVSRPLAIIFTIIIVLVMSAAVFSLFLGGRWLFENLDGSNEPTTTVVVTNPITETTPTASSTTAAETNPAGASSNQPSTSTSNGTGATSSSSNTSPKPVSNTVITASAIPATGPSETIVLFVLTAIIATLAHSVWLRFRQAN